MTRMRAGAHGRLRWFALNLPAVVAAVAVTCDGADARRHHGRIHYAHHTAHGAARAHRVAHGEGYAPPTSSIIVDGNSGAVLEESNPDALRHPASLTKVMTLYLLFERLEAGKIALDTPLRVSEHAAEQSPTKLGLRPGQTIPVEDAIKGIVTRSANDAAVVIAENLGGSEEDFARMMTQKARALGMSRTTYVNASGLPDDDQITTARDQATLGRAIQERFPRYFRYFSTPSFVYHGEVIRNHDHLLGQVDGVDGIKTGFTRASGFNLLTSLHRDGRYIVGVVMGGRSAFERDAHMRNLITEHFKEASLRRTAPMVAERSEPREPAQPVTVAVAKATSAVRADPAPISTASARIASATANTAIANANDPIRPLLVKTITFRTVTVQSASLAPMPVLVPVQSPAPSAVPAQSALQANVRAPAAPVAAEQPRVVVAAADPASTSSAASRRAAVDPVRADFASLTGAQRPQPVAAQPAVAQAPAARVTVAQPAVLQTAAAEQVVSVPARAEMPKAETISFTPAQAHAHGGWLIQIGAYDGEDEARQHLSAAQAKVRSALASADPFTERVLKGDKALYRARFAGFDKATAEAACKELKRSDFQCMALKD